MPERKEQSQEIIVAGLFGELRTWANKVDIATARSNQKDPNRQAFVQAVVDNLLLYNSEPSQQAKGADTSKAYLNAVKQALSSRTTELFALIEACQKGDMAAFGSITNALHLAALRLLGREPPKEVVTSPQPALRLRLGDYPKELAQGFGSSFGKLLDEGGREFDAAWRRGRRSDADSNA